MKTVYSYHGSTLNGYTRLDLIIATPRGDGSNMYAHMTTGMAMPRCVNIRAI